MDLDHERRLTEVEGKAETNSLRIDAVEKRQDGLESLATAVATLATREEQVEADVKEIKGDVKSLTAIPGKRWNDFADKVVWALLAAVIGFVLAHMGIGG